MRISDWSSDVCSSDLIDTAKERYLIMLRRENGNPPNSWTDDPIFQTYRFCNVFREHDRVTRWYRQNVSGPIGHSNVDQFRAAVVFRLLNRETSGELIKQIGRASCRERVCQYV